MLTSGQLAKMRTVANKLLPDTAVIYTRALADDGRGGKLASWTEGESVACRLSAASVRGRAKDATHGDRIEPAEGWIVSLPVDAVVGEADRLKINGIFYEVISSNTRRSFDVNLRLICKQV